MKTAFQSIKGTFDVLPDESSSDGARIAGTPAWRFVESTIRDVLGRFGMQEIRTPVLEPTELIARGIGALTDIVSKEMFSFERGDTNYVLRPEITAPVMRAYLQHRLDQRGGVQKLYYVGPCFRAERPQKGRYRQFHQFGCEIIGSRDARADAEVLAAMMAVYEAFGIVDSTLRINTLGDEASRPRYKDALRAYLQPYASALGETSRRRLEANPLRILDTKDAAERKLLESAPLLIDYVDDASREHFDQVKSYLSELGISYRVDPFLVRGLDYYTRTAFELESPDVGAQSALAGGGRYDLLALEIGNDTPVPAVGFAAGMERLFLALFATENELPVAHGVDVYVVALGDDAARWAFRETGALRKAGLSAAFDLDGRSMKAQMREANRMGARLTVVVGDNEITTGEVQVRNMADSSATAVPMAKLQSFIQEQLRTA